MKTPKITKQEMLQAITDGVHRAFDDHMPYTEQIMDSIRNGVDDAVWRMITRDTIFPCELFYHNIKQGVYEAVSESCDSNVCVDELIENGKADAVRKTAEDLTCGDENKRASVPQ